MSDRLRVQKCDNCDEWKNPLSLIEVEVVRKTPYVRTAEKPTPITETRIELWCPPCHQEVHDLLNPGPF